MNKEINTILRYFFFFNWPYDIKGFYTFNIFREVGGISPQQLYIEISIKKL